MPTGGMTARILDNARAASARLKFHYFDDAPWAKRHARLASEMRATKCRTRSMTHAMHRKAAARVIAGSFPGMQAMHAGHKDHRRG